MSDYTVIELPWPMAKLSPNGRGHWRTKETARGEAKQTGYVNALRRFGDDAALDGPLKIFIVFHPPDRKRYDWDNLVGRMKYYQDGIFQALGVNDNQIKRAEVVMGEPQDQGAVIVRIETIGG